MQKTRYALETTATRQKIQIWKYDKLQRGKPVYIVQVI